MHYLQRLNRARALFAPDGVDGGGDPPEAKDPNKSPADAEDDDGDETPPAKAEQIEKTEDQIDEWETRINRLEKALDKSTATNAELKKLREELATAQTKLEAAESKLAKLKASPPSQPSPSKPAPSKSADADDPARPKPNNAPEATPGPQSRRRRWV